MKEKVEQDIGGLNGTQKNIIKGTLFYYLEDIEELEAPNFIKALIAIYTDIADKKLLKKLDVLEGIEFIKKFWTILALKIELIIILILGVLKILV